MTIERIKELSTCLEEVSGIEALLLIGSQARGDASPNSDWDFSLLVDEKRFDPNQATEALRAALGSAAQQVLLVRLRSNLTAYLKSGTRLEFNYYGSLQGLERNFMGSEIPPERLADCLFFDHTQTVLDHLGGLKRTSYNFEYFDSEALVNKFAYEFENSSSNHRRSDSYRFYYHYNIALNVAVQLGELVKETPHHPYLPKNFFRKHFEPKQSETGSKKLSGSLWLPDANEKKRNLLEFFYASLDLLIEKHGFDLQRAHSIREFLEWVYVRDFFWNLRDISKHNPCIRPGRVFRSASPTLLQYHPQVRVVFTHHQITDVIDLRDHQEVEASPYAADFLVQFNYHHLPIDPKKQSEVFQQQHAQTGTHVQIAYRYFALECREQIARTIRVLLEAEGAVLIHCHAGKDRTGALVTVLHLLTETPREVWIEDYLASEMDTTAAHLDAFLEQIEAEGGVRDYLRNCGLTVSEIEALTEKLRHRP
jgi:predicted nucleotidyltransferase/protein tyrosine phosphatase (PTP) superfamily phosphohydrolase (DUF442 family)